MKKLVSSLVERIIKKNIKFNLVSKSDIPNNYGFKHNVTEIIGYIEFYLKQHFYLGKDYDNLELAKAIAKDLDEIFKQKDDLRKKRIKEQLPKES